MHPSTPNKADAFAYAQQAGRASRSRNEDGYAEQALVSAFRNAMNALDIATRSHPSRGAFEEVSRLGLEVVHQFERMTSDLHELRHHVNLAQREARIADMRLSVCRAERDSLEESYIQAKLDVQDISSQASEMNEQRHEITRFARSLERTLKEVTSNLEETRKVNIALTEALRSAENKLSEAIAHRAKATAEKDEVLSRYEIAAKRVSELVTEKVNAVKIARKRRLVLLDVKKHFEGDGMLVEADLIDKIRNACRMIDYTTGEQTEAVDEEYGMKPSELSAIADEMNAEAAALASAMPQQTAEAEIAEAVEPLRRLHEWSQSEGSADIICKFCGVAKWEVDTEGGDAAVYCLETGINDLAAHVTVADVMETKAAE